MDFQPKTEPASSSTSHESFNEMSISALVSDLRANCDKVEEVFFARDAKHKAEIGSLTVKYELERLQRLHIEDELNKKQQEYLNLERKWSELEEENKKNMETIRKLKDEKSRLEKEKCNADAKTHLNEMVAVPDSSPSKKRKKGVGHCTGKSSGTMAKKTLAKRQKTSGNKKKKYDKSNTTRCSPSDVAKLIKALGEEQKACVRDMGFGALEHLSNKNMSKRIMIELVDCFNTKDNTMRTTLGTIKLDVPKVGHALGLNATGHTFEKKIDNKQLNDEQKAAVKMFKNATPITLKKIVIETKPDSEENKRKFKRAFILYVQKVFLCANNTTPISPKHFPAIVNVDNTREMNWARHVCSFLLDGITEMRHKNLKGVEGCVFALLIIYMHETHFGKDSEDEKAQPPWVSYWKGEKLSQRMRVEKRDSNGLLRQANQRKETTEKKKTSQLKKLKTPIKIGKQEALSSKLVKSPEIEDDPIGKKKLGKRKHVEDDESEDVSSESESEGDSSESESEGGSESETRFSENSFSF